MNLFKSLVAATVLAASVVGAHAAPIVYSGSLASGVTSFGDVPRNSYLDPSQWDFWSFSGNAGDVVTITANRTSGDMDPGVILYFGAGVDTAGLSFGSTSSADGFLTFLALDDDGGSDIPPGPFANSLISNFALAATGTYTIAVMDVLGAASSGPWSYGVTVSGATGGTVPAPGTLALAGIALAGLAAAARKRHAG